MQLSVLFLSVLLSFSPSALAAPVADSCVSINVQSLPSTIDMERVREVWFGWYNDYRASLGLEDYVPDALLNRTAGNWSFYAVKRGTIDHRRAWKAPYYDYKAIESWFSNFGITFPNVRRKTYTENIGWGSYACSDTDCTDELITSIRSTFHFFLQEKDAAYRPHYNAIVSDAFTKIGMGIGIDSSSKRYYLTTHFATDIASPRPQVCDEEVEG